MIKLSELSKETLNNHIYYFIHSEGYEILKTLSSNTNIATIEQDFYKGLLIDDNLKLINILTGNPLKLRAFINDKSIMDLLNNEVEDAEMLSKANANLDLIYSRQDDFAELNEEAIDIIINRIVTDLPLVSFSDEIECYRKTKRESKPISKKNKKYLHRDLKKKIIFAKTIAKSVISRFELIFDYDRFVKGNKDWGAYKLVDAIGIRVCPYCNRSFIDIIDSVSGKTRPDIDHFYPKSLYPFLSMSIYNMIPSCGVCNSSFKGKIDFFNTEHCHPYEDSFHDFGKFVLNKDSKIITVDSIINTESSINNLDIVLKPKRDISIEKFNHSKKTFHLEDLYNLHKDCALELLNKSILYSSDRIEDLKKINIANNKILFKDVDFSRLILGNFTKPRKFNLRPLSKFTYDIADEVGLLKTLGIEYKEKVEY